MSDDLVSRDALREMLFDGELPPPPPPEEMFDRTFGSDGDAGADLLPPDTLYDEPGHDPFDDDVPVDDIAPDPADHPEPEDVEGGFETHDGLDDPAHSTDAPEHGDPLDHPADHDVDAGDLGTGG